MSDMSSHDIGPAWLDLRLGEWWRKAYAVCIVVAAVMLVASGPTVAWYYRAIFLAIVARGCIHLHRWGWWGKRQP